MSEEERKRMRKIQDEFIQLAEKQGANDNDLVIEDLDKTTLGDVKKFIYPQYEGVFKDYIENY